MSGPPPPPPPSAPPPPMFAPSKGGGGGPDDRSALLKSIRGGAKLKKTVTNDKSAPIIPGKSNNSSTSSSISSPGGGNAAPSPIAPNGMNLGGLFAGGMPKLRATGKLGSSNLNNNNNNENINNGNGNIRKRPDAQPIKSFNSNVQNELKKQLASDNKNRGPPPPAPVRNVTDENGFKSPMSATAKSSTLNGYRMNPPSSIHSNLQLNHSTLHRKTKSNANLSNLDSTDSSSVNGFNPTPSKPVINYGKPNLAPKPPTLNGKPVAPPKKLIINGKPISRAHSMRSPRSPSPQSPDNPTIKFGTVKNLSSVIGQSLGHSTGNLSPRPRPMLNGRPSAPPPSIPNQTPPPPPPHSPSPSLGQAPPPPPSKTGGVRPPNHAPPPPPGVLPQPPSHAPPLPPHRTQPTRPPPAIPNMSAPPPPPRHSSMREGNTLRKQQIVDFDEKFKPMFHQSNMFPKPPPYKHVIKLYSQRQAVSKQQAPLPPNMQPAANRTWDTSSTC